MSASTLKQKETQLRAAHHPDDSNSNTELMLRAFITLFCRYCVLEALVNTFPKINSQRKLNRKSQLKTLLYMLLFSQ